MYSQSKSCVRLNNTLTDFFGNYVGVKQGDNLSPNLFTGEHPAIFIIAVLINYGLQDKHVVRYPSFFCKPHLAIIDHMVFIKELN
jgi:hypothetical protein